MRLVAVIPYYNYFRNGPMRDNHIEHMRDLDRQGVEHVTYELSITGRYDFQESENVRHVWSRSMIWHKEDLINKAASELSYDALAWLDSGTLLEDGWDSRVLRALDEHDLVQCFSHAYWNSFSGMVEMAEAGIMFAQDIRAHSCTYGGAWAAKRSFFDKLGLFAYNVIGGGDTVFISAIIGRNKRLNHKYYSNAHLKAIDEWLGEYERIGFRSGYIYGQWYHLWHGDMCNRQYIKRYEVLRDIDFNPLIDLVCRNGILEWSDDGVRGDGVKEYFLRRNRMKD